MMVILITNGLASNLIFKNILNIKLNNFYFEISKHLI